MLTVPNGNAQRALLRAALADARGPAARELRGGPRHGDAARRSHRGRGDRRRARGRARAGRSPSPRLDQGQHRAPRVGRGRRRPHQGRARPAPRRAPAADPLRRLEPGDPPRRRAPRDPGHARPLAERDAHAHRRGQLLRDERHQRPRDPGRGSPPAPRRPSVERPFDLLWLSAKSAPALRDAAERWAKHLEVHAGAPFGDVCHTSRVGRSHFAHRLAVVAASPEQARRALASHVAGEAAKGVTRGQVARAKLPRVAFLFTGQGAQHAGMGRALFEAEPVFRAALEECDALLGRTSRARSSPSSTRSRASLRCSTRRSTRSRPCSRSGTRSRSSGAPGASSPRRSWATASASTPPPASPGPSTSKAASGSSRRARLMHELPRAGEMAAVLADPATVAARLADAGPTVSSRRSTARRTP